MVVTVCTRGTYYIPLPNSMVYTGVCIVPYSTLHTMLPHVDSMLPLMHHVTNHYPSHHVTNYRYILLVIHHIMFYVTIC